MTHVKMKPRYTHHPVATEVEIGSTVECRVDIQISSPYVHTYDEEKFTASTDCPEAMSRPELAASNIFDIQVNAIKTFALV